MAKLDKNALIAISHILDRGNTCELKMGKDGLWINEIKRSVKYRPSDHTGKEAETNKSAREI